MPMQTKKPPISKNISPRALFLSSRSTTNTVRAVARIMPALWKMEKRDAWSKVSSYPSMMRGMALLNSPLERAKAAMKVMT